MTMEKIGQDELIFGYPGWTIEDGKGALATEDAYSIEASPLGSDLSSLPPLDLAHPPLSPLDMSFLDPEMGLLSAAGSLSQPPSSSGQLDPAIEDYTQSWRRLVHESSMLTSSLFLRDQSNSAFTFDADPTPPLAFDFDIPVPAAPANTSDVAEQQSLSTSSVEVVAPKPIRLANPAIHLAALVEDPDETAAASSQGGHSEDAEGSEVEEGIFESPLQKYGYSMEQLREYMSDSESSCGDSEAGHVEENEDATPSVATFQFTYPTYHDLPNPSLTAQYYDTLPPSPLSALSPPASPLSPLTPIIPQISRSSQLREMMRERRSARHGHGQAHGPIGQQGQGHSRHSSVPDIHYRPPGWNEVHSSESSTHTTLRRHRENASHSVDWSAGVIRYPPPSDSSQQFEQYSEGYDIDFQYPYPRVERTYHQ